MSDYMNGPIQTLIFNKNPYKRTEWEDDLIDPITNEVLEEGTTFWAEYANNMEWGIFNSFEMLVELNKRLKSIIAQLELDGRVPSANGNFLDAFDGSSSRIKLLSESTYLKSDVTAGSSVSLSVIDASMFKAFTFATIFDGTNYEHVYITGVSTSANTITVQTLAKNYVKGAIITRSSVLVDTVNQVMDVGPHIAYQVNLVEVV